MAADKDNKPKYRKLNGNDLSKEERDALMQNYGPQFGSSQDFTRVGSFGSLIYEPEFNIKSGGSAYYAHPVTEIRSLTRGEEWFFEGKGFVSPHFCVQVLYKVKGYVTRSAFRLALYKLVENNPNLRAGYCNLGKRTVKVIFKDRQFLVNYQNINSLSEESIQKTLDKLIEKDRLQGFDLVHGPLFRITIFHTQEGGDDTREEIYSGEYAILITESHLIMDFWNPLQFIRDTFGDNTGSASVEGSRFLFADALAEQDADNAPSTKTYWQASLAHGYWRKILKNPPVTLKLPGHITVGRAQGAEAVINRVISEEDMKLLNELATRNKVSDAAMLQLAWALYVQNENNTDDALFCVLMPEPTMNTKTASQNAALLHPMFIRVKCLEKNNASIAELVSEQMQKMLTSQSFAWLYMDEITQGLSLPQDIFSYFLSFHGFLTERLVYDNVPATASASSVSMESWDAGGIDLGVYFLYEANSIKTTFRYNSAAFKIGAVERMAQDFHLVIHNMLLNWNDTLDKFRVEYGKTQRRKRSRDISQIHMQKAYQYLSNLDMFRALKEDTLWRFASAAQIHTCQRDADIPKGEGLFVFLMYGSIDRYLQFPNGVKEKLDRVREKRWINENAVFKEKAKANITFSIVSSPTVIMTLPARIVENEERVFNFLYEHAAGAMKSYLEYKK